MIDTALIAPDGSPVAVFRALPPGPGPSLVASCVRAAATVLDLGAGAGRVATPLAAAGFRVTAVDQSPAMLAAIGPAVETVVADIRGLDLGRRFDAVVLASYLINDASGIAFLETCARHVAVDGVVILQRYDPLWVREARPDATTVGNVTIAVDSFDVRAGEGGFAMTVTYGVDGQEWVQRVDAVILDDEALATRAATAGLRVDRWLDDFRTWAVLRRAS